MDKHLFAPRSCAAALTLAVGLSVGASAADAQWVRQNEQFYLPAEHNWVFRKHYRTADRLFNAFDYGHAILYEELYRHPDAPVERLEQKEYNFVTRKLLVNPPHVPLEEAAIEKAYVKLAPEAKLMFEWAHVLHRQIYDVLADERLTRAQKDAAVAELVRYYKSRPDLAFSSRPKNMELMEGQYYSTAFREKYPKFNGLIWAYHWLQVGLYEPLLVGDNIDERQRGVLAAVTRFWQMLEDAPTNMPRVMPMTAAIAPEFARRYPEAAIIFDNLHGMHDVISDILASSKVPRERKRAEILKAASHYRDNTSFVMTEQEWRDMAQMMGVENQGGPVMGFLAGFAEPTVERGAVMAGMDHSAHAAPAASGAPRGGHPEIHHHDVRPTDTGGMLPYPPDSIADGHPETAHQLHLRMLQDPVIRQRMMADTAMHRILMELVEQMPAEHREHMMHLMHGAGSGDATHHHDPAPSASQPAATRRSPPTARPAPARKPASTGRAAPAKAPARRNAAPAKADPHAGHGKPPAAKADPHAGHRKPPAAKADPHAGHGKRPAAPAARDTTRGRQ